MSCSTARARVWVALATAVMAAPPGAALAQFPPPPAGPAPVVRDRWPGLQDERSPPPAAQPAPQRTPAPSDAAPPPPKTPPAAPANAVACSGVFGRDSTHLKLAIKYDSRNITYGEVDGPEGSKIPATILFPNDPKRRLEVMWAQEGARSGTSLIAINGKSQWSAPRGTRIGLSLAALEKANGRPFKISGFDKDGAATVAGWEGGALSSVAGGCKVGIRLNADPKSTPEVRSAAADKEYLSDDPAVRALKPTIAEILIGY